MDYKEKTRDLRSKIEKALAPCVDRNYVFLDLPYHPNVGDTLIAMAAKEYLNKTPYKCLYSSSEFTFDDREIKPDTLIIFNGGGNFGDLWPRYTIFRNKIIKKYPKNKILILPQSVSYSDNLNLAVDVELYSSCANITVCARDKFSYNFLCEHFRKNNILLVPDMAFYTSDNYLNHRTTSKGKTLFLYRSDKELQSELDYSQVPQEAERHDWPTMESGDKVYKVYNSFNYVNARIEKYISNKIAWRLKDLYWQKKLHPYNVRRGVDFVDEYEVIYTTRLHVMILGFLLGKEVYVFDNSYKKNSALYETWLNDVPTIQMV